MCAAGSQEWSTAMGGKGTEGRVRRSCWVPKFLGVGVRAGDLAGGQGSEQLLGSSRLRDPHGFSRESGRHRCKDSAGATEASQAP